MQSQVLWLLQYLLSLVFAVLAAPSLSAPVSTAVFTIHIIVAVYV